MKEERNLGFLNSSIHKYQRKYGSEVVPSQRKIDLELFYNEYDIFKSLFKYLKSVELSGTRPQDHIKVGFDNLSNIF